MKNLKEKEILNWKGINIKIILRLEEDCIESHEWRKERRSSWSESKEK